MEAITCSIKETEAYAADLMKQACKKEDLRTHALVVGLSGELGAGKTAFVKAAAHALGVEDTVTSPTFVIEKIYKLKNTPFAHLIHIDAYRLESADELRALGWDDITRDSGNIVFLEWPERVKEVLPDNMVRINLEVVGEKERKITVSH